MTSQPLTLYQRLGGPEVARAAIDSFQDRLLADPLLASRLIGVDLTLQRELHEAFLTLACGGPESRSLWEGLASGSRVMFHAPTDRQFQRVLGHLAAALAEVGLTGELVASVVAAAESCRCSCIILSDEKAPLRPVRQEAGAPSSAFDRSPADHPG